MTVSLVDDFTTSLTSSHVDYVQNISHERVDVFFKTPKDLRHYTFKRYNVSQTFKNYIILPLTLLSFIIYYGLIK